MARSAAECVDRRFQLIAVDSEQGAHIPEMFFPRPKTAGENSRFRIADRGTDFNGAITSPVSGAAKPGQELQQHGLFLGAGLPR